jgi:hypothetical protein
MGIYRWKDRDTFLGVVGRELRAGDFAGRAQMSDPEVEEFIQRLADGVQDFVEPEMEFAWQAELDLDSDEIEVKVYEVGRPRRLAGWETERLAQEVGSFIARQKWR